MVRALATVGALGAGWVLLQAAVTVFVGGIDGWCSLAAFAGTAFFAAVFWWLAFYLVCGRGGS